MSMRSSYNLSVIPSAISMVLLAFAIAGCASNDFALEDTHVPMSPAERFPIEYSKAPVTLEVSSAYGTLQPAQVNAVAGFVRQSLAAGPTPVAIRRPAGGGKSAQVANEIAGLMIQQGIPRSMIRTGTYPAPSSAPVQIGYVKAYAHTKPCGEWPEDLTETSSNRPFTNHGCAVQSNIAAMIANPDNVNGPAPVSLATAETSTAAIKKLGTDATSTTTTSASTSASSN